MELSKELDDIYKAYLENNSDFSNTSSKEEAIVDLKRLAKSPYCNFIVQNDFENLTIRVKSFRIIYFVLNLIIFGFPLLVLVNNLNLFFLVGFIVYNFIMIKILGNEAKTINKLKFNLKEGELTISNINFLGKILFPEKTIAFDEIQEIFAKKREIKASKGARQTLNRIFIRIKSENEIPIIDLSANRFRYINEKRFMKNLLIIIKN